MVDAERELIGKQKAIILGVKRTREEERVYSYYGQATTAEGHIYTPTVKIWSGKKRS